MTKQNRIDREYIVVAPGGAVATNYLRTRAEARELLNKLGGRKKGYKILQQFIVQREVR